MPKYNVVFESNEEIYGIVPRAYDWVHYKSILNPKTRERVQVAPKRLPFFKIGKELKERVDY